MEPQLEGCGKGMDSLKRPGEPARFNGAAT